MRRISYGYILLFKTVIAPTCGTARTADDGMYFGVRTYVSSANRSPTPGRRGLPDSPCCLPLSCAAFNSFGDDVSPLPTFFLVASPLDPSGPPRTVSNGRFIVKTLAEPKATSPSVVGPYHCVSSFTHPPPPVPGIRNLMDRLRVWHLPVVAHS